MKKSAMPNPKYLFGRVKKRNPVKTRKCRVCKGTGGAVTGTDCKTCGGSGYIVVKSTKKVVCLKGANGMELYAKGLNGRYNIYIGKKQGLRAGIAIFNKTTSDFYIADITNKNIPKRKKQPKFNGDIMQVLKYVYLQVQKTK